MPVCVTLPNKKEVQLKEFIFKDCRELCSFVTPSVSGAINFLESFIYTKNLNVLEKFLALVMLRQKCIGKSIILDTPKGPINFGLKYIIDNIGNIEEIAEEVILNNVRYTLNYPTKFNIGDTDSTFSIIEKIKIDDEEIIVGELNDSEYNQLINTLPETLYYRLNEYVEKHNDFFTIKLWEGREQLELQGASLNLLSSSFAEFLINFYNTLKEEDYIKTIFVMSRRFSDLNFIMNCTSIEIEKLFKEYKEEVDKQKQEQATENQEERWQNQEQS
tara:strand:- start:823 stop:1644 length:822 start_codon:yes stop_codon:yes gene_type:complete